MHLCKVINRRHSVCGGAIKRDSQSNGDGIISPLDLIALQQALKGQIPVTPGMDCNQDGVVDNKDKSCIAQQIGNYKNQGQGKGNGSGSGSSLGNTAAASTSGTSSLYIYFVYDESGHLLGEYNQNGNLIEEHIWLGSQPIGVITPTGLYYVTTDQLNTPRAITNANQQLVWEWSSDPFGTTAPNQNPSGLGTLTYILRFPGQYYDAETGHNYNYFRDYDPSIGRYMESDPIGLGGGINTYAYVMNNPMGHIDPLGWAVYVMADEVSVAGYSTNPPSYHLYLLLVPDNPQDFSNHTGWQAFPSGDIWASLSAHPSYLDAFGNLVYTPNYSGNGPGNSIMGIVKTPCGQSDTQFINNLIKAANTYQNNLPYSWPNLASGYIGPGEYNSNSFIAGIIDTAGGSAPILTTTPYFQVPGYSNPVPIP